MRVALVHAVKNTRRKAKERADRCRMWSGSGDGMGREGKGKGGAAVIREYERGNAARRGAAAEERRKDS